MEPPAEPAPGPARSAAETPAGDQPATPEAKAATGGAAKVPAVEAAAEEAQPEPSLAGDAAGSASESSDSGTEDEASAGEVKEEEDLFASGSDEGANGAAGTAAG